MEEDSLNQPQTQDNLAADHLGNARSGEEDMDDYGEEGEQQRASAEMVVDGDMDNDEMGVGDDPYGEEMDELDDGIPINSSQADLN